MGQPATTRARTISRIAFPLAFVTGYTGFLWLIGGWEAVASVWLALLIFFGPILVALKCGWPSLGKRPNGGRSWAARLLFLPYLLLTRFAFELVMLFSREEPFAVVAPNLAFGRRQTEWEARRSEFVSVLDLTAEFAEVRHFRSRAGYQSLPVFDRTAPTAEQLRFAVDWLREAVTRGPVYVHCALGHGRSACVVLAYLLAQGKVATVADGVRFLRERRPKVRLARGQRDALRGFERTET